MLLLNLFKELIEKYSNLNPQVSLAYSMEKFDFVGGGILLGQSFDLRRPHFKNLPNKADRVVGFQEMFIDKENLCIKRISINEWFFIPGKSPGVIIFGKNMSAIQDNELAIKGASWRPVEIAA